MNKSPPFGACWQILPRVSRSFALVIRWLPRHLDDAVMVSYLLCRIADTIEDSSLPAGERRRLLKGFAAALDSGLPELPAGGYGLEYECLMSRAEDVLACYRSLPPAARAPIRRRVEEMCSGMARWCGEEIRTMRDQNDYCYYVAGLVGLMLTDLFHAYGRLGDKEAEAIRPLAADFGLALQKVNILRDLRADVLEGRCYWPSEVLGRHGLSPRTVLAPENIDKAMAAMRDLVADHWTYLRRALRYLVLLPMGQLRLRIFCAIPLFMAEATVRFCEGNPAVFMGPRPVKIPGVQVRGIVMRALSLGSCNGYLLSWFRRWERGALDRVSPFHAVASLIP